MTAGAAASRINQAIIVSADKHAHQSVPGIVRCAGLESSRSSRITRHLETFFGLEQTENLDAARLVLKINREESQFARRQSPVFSGQASRSVARILAPNGGIRIFVGMPKGEEQLFDYAICAAHDLTRGEFGNPLAFKGAGQCLWMQGVACKTIPHSKQGDVTAVFLGGNNKAFTFESR